MNTEVRRNTSEEEVPPRGYTYYTNPVSSKVHHFYISNVIEDPEFFIEMIHTIKTAGPQDVAYIYLNSPGGRLDTTLQLINAMRISPAKIVTVIEAEAHSAGTMIFLAADEFVVHENTMMMFHNFSGGAFGKGNELKLQVDAVVKWFNKMAVDIYSPFLSDEEIQDLIDGKDIWMEAEEIRDRLKSMVKVQAEERDAQAAAAAAECLDEDIKALEDEIAALKKLVPKKKVVTKKKAATKKKVVAKPKGPFKKVEK